jgi:hypothetical protein
MPILDRCNDAVWRGAPIAQLLWRRLARNGLAQRSVLPDASIPANKNILIYRISGLSYVCVHSGPRKRGVSRSSRHAGRTAVDMGHIGARGFAGRATVSESIALTTVWLVDGKIVWSWRPGFWRQVLR